MQVCFHVTCRPLESCKFSLQIFTPRLCFTRQTAAEETRKDLNKHRLLLDVCFIKEPFRLVELQQILNTEKGNFKTSLKCLSSRFRATAACAAGR